MSSSTTHMQETDACLKSECHMAPLCSPRQLLSHEAAVVEAVLRPHSPDYDFTASEIIITQTSNII